MCETVYVKGKYQIIKTKTNRCIDGTLFDPKYIEVDKYIVKYADHIFHTSQFGWFDTIKGAKKRLNGLPQ